MEEQLRAKLYLNMILKDDEPVALVKRSLDSLKNSVDGIYVALTYTTTPPTDTAPLAKLLRSYKANVFPFQWVHDFSQARQFVLDKTPKGEDAYIYWQDADDVLVNGEKLHTLADEAYQIKAAAIALDYWYAVDLDKEGNVREILVRHKRERIVRNDDTFKWIGSLHETLIEQRFENVSKYARPECHLIHLTTRKRLDSNLERNIAILETTAEEEGHKDPRTLIYLAKAYYDKGKLADTLEIRKEEFGKALRLFHEYLNGWGKPGTPGYHPGAGWADERAQAWDYIGQIAILLKNYDIAVHAFQSAIDEAPQYPMYFVNLAMAYAMQGEYKKAKHWLRVSTNIPEPETTSITTPRDLKTKVLEVDYAVALAESRLEAAKKDVELLIGILPDDPELKDRLQFIESLWFANKASQSIVFLGKYLEQIKEPERIKHLIDAVPRDLQGEKFVSEMRHIHIPPRVHENNEIAILCGPGWEQWSPKSLEKGLGGSEEAVVYLSRELANRGWKVTVYANPQQETGDYDGVFYKPWHELNVRDEF
jgi:tetratricopeptide (TPR) repeat protein